MVDYAQITASNTRIIRVVFSTIFRSGWKAEIQAHNFKKKPSRLRQFIRKILAIFVTLGRHFGKNRSRYPRFFSICDVTIQDKIFCVARLERTDPAAHVQK